MAHPRPTIIPKDTKKNKDKPEKANLKLPRLTLPLVPDIVENVENEDTNDKEKSNDD